MFGTEWPWCGSVLDDQRTSYVLTVVPGTTRPRIFEMRPESHRQPRRTMGGNEYRTDLQKVYFLNLPQRDRNFGYTGYRFLSTITFEQRCTLQNMKSTKQKPKKPKS